MISEKTLKKCLRVTLKQASGTVELVEIPETNAVLEGCEHVLAVLVHGGPVDHRLVGWHVVDSGRWLIGSLFVGAGGEKLTNTSAGADIPDLDDVETAGESQVTILGQDADEVDVVEVVPQGEYLCCALQIQ